MKLQGNVPLSAKDEARNLRSITGWQKYVVYNMLVELAVEFSEPNLQFLAFEPMSADNHEVSKEFMESAKVRNFRASRQSVSNAEFFRAALFQGAQIVNLFMSKTLPDEVSPKSVAEKIKNSVGNHEKFSAGLEFFEGHLRE
jgi:hypothetical protein